MIHRAPTGITIQDGWWEDLGQRYAEPLRAYHTLHHVAEVLSHWRAIDSHDGWMDRTATWTAVLLHDVVYEPGAVPPGSNERASAALVRPWTEQFGISVDVDAVEELILATADHGANQDATGDRAMFLDADVAILGAEPDRYALYADQVRQEYEPFLPPGAFEGGRVAFLKKMLGKPVFISDRFRDRYEQIAKRNLAWELARLEVC